MLPESTSTQFECHSLSRVDYKALNWYLENLTLETGLVSRLKSSTFGAIIHKKGKRWSIHEECHGKPATTYYQHDNAILLWTGVRSKQWSVDPNAPFASQTLPVLCLKISSAQALCVKGNKNTIPFLPRLVTFSLWIKTTAIASVFWGSLMLNLLTRKHSQV